MATTTNITPNTTTSSLNTHSSDKFVNICCNKFNTEVIYISNALNLLKDGYTIPFIYIESI